MRADSTARGGRPLHAPNDARMRILITAGGTVTAQSLIKALREDRRRHEVVIGDMDPLNATRAFVDGFVQLPRADAPDFAQACLDAVKQHRTQLLIPLIVEREFLPLAAHREAFEKLGCTLWVPDVATIHTIGDKLLFAQFLERHGIRGPKTWAYEPELAIDRFPVYLKPRRASGSVGTQLVRSAASMHEAAAGRSELIVQEVADGPEFTVDAFASAPGRVVAAIPRERILIKSGVSVKGRTYHHPEIEALVADVVAKSGIVGPANVQGMLDADGAFSIIEMNPRFSGTLALTTAAGVNLGSMLIDVVEGRGDEVPDMRGKHQADVVMLRYWSELFQDSGGSYWNGTPLGTSITRNSAGAIGTTR